MNRRSSKFHLSVVLAIGWLWHGLPGLSQTPLHRIERTLRLSEFDLGRSQAVVDLGDLVAAKPIEIALRIVNDSGSPKHYNFIAAGCSCRDVTFAAGPLKTGESRVMTIRIPRGVRAGQGGTGFSVSIGSKAGPGEYDGDGSKGLGGIFASRPSGETRSKIQFGFHTRGLIEFSSAQSVVVVPPGESRVTARIPLTIGEPFTFADLDFGKSENLGPRSYRDGILEIAIDLNALPDDRRSFRIEAYEPETGQRVSTLLLLDEQLPFEIAPLAIHMKAIKQESGAKHGEFKGNFILMRERAAEKTGGKIVPPNPVTSPILSVLPTADWKYELSLKKVSDDLYRGTLTASARKSSGRVNADEVAESENAEKNVTIHVRWDGLSASREVSVHFWD